MYNNGGQLFLTHSPVTGNNATGGDNSAPPCDANTAGFGGGILNAVEGGTVGIGTLTRSDVTGNSAKNDGAALQRHRGTGQATQDVFDLDQMAALAVKN
jgi:hypothetical protein